LFAESAVRRYAGESNPKSSRSESPDTTLLSTSSQSDLHACIASRAPSPPPLYALSRLRGRGGKPLAKKERMAPTGLYAPSESSPKGAPEGGGE